jgi:hypothetical protein
MWSIDASTEDLTNESHGMVTNVAWDMFVDSDTSKAQIDGQARFEIMIWVGTYGDPKPIGFSDGPCLKQKVSISNHPL